MDKCAPRRIRIVADQREAFRAGRHTCLAQRRRHVPTFTAILGWNQALRRKGGTGDTHGRARAMSFGGWLLGIAGRTTEKKQRRSTDDASLGRSSHE